MRVKGKFRRCGSASKKRERESRTQSGPQRWRFILKSHRFYILLFPVAIWLAFIGVKEITRDFGSERLYDRDFISPYQIGRASCRDSEILDSGDGDVEYDSM